MTTKTIKIGIKQREVELRDVEQLDFDGYKNQICTYKKTEKYTPKRQQNLTQAQRTASDIRRPAWRSRPTRATRKGSFEI